MKIANWKNAISKPFEPWFNHSQFTQLELIDVYFVSCQRTKKKLLAATWLTTLSAPFRLSQRWFVKDDTALCIILIFAKSKQHGCLFLLFKKTRTEAGFFLQKWSKSPQILDNWQTVCEHFITTVYSKAIHWLRLWG